MVNRQRYYRTGSHQPFQVWQFWRPEFWLRPALVAALAVLLASFGGWLLLVDAAATYQGARQIQEAPECAGAPETGCLARVDAEVTSTYRLARSSDYRSRFDRVGPSPRASIGEAVLPSGKLAERDQVEVLLWQGEIVAVERESGERLRVNGYRPDDWVGSLFGGVSAVAVAVLLVQHARARRARLGGWWTTGKPSLDLAGPTPLNWTAAGFALCPGPGFALSTLWLSTWSALAVGFALALLVAGLAVAGLLPHRITPFRAP